MTEKMDWKVCLTPAEREGQVHGVGYLVLPNKGRVDFTIVLTYKELMQILRDAGDSIQNVLTAMTKQEEEQN